MLFSLMPSIEKPLIVGLVLSRLTLIVFLSLVRPALSVAVIARSPLSAPPVVPLSLMDTSKVVSPFSHLTGVSFTV